MFLLEGAIDEEGVVDVERMVSREIRFFAVGVAQASADDDELG